MSSSDLKQTNKQTNFIIPHVLCKGEPDIQKCAENF